MQIKTAVSGNNMTGDMMKTDKTTLLAAAGGFAVGVVNGMLGAGGGMIAVPLLGKILNDRKLSHVNSVALILPLSALSAIAYLLGGITIGNELYILIPFGMLGALAGTFLMKKISGKWLRRIFSLMLIYAGVRMLLA